MTPSVLVTGGTTRVGQIIADHLAKMGWRVIRSSHRDDSSADVFANLTEKDGADFLFNRVFAKFGFVPDALVNNAALFSDSRENLRAVNVDAPVRLTELFAKTATSVRTKSIVNILDRRILAHAPQDDYAQTKADLLRATHAQAREFLGRARINAVAPGPILASTTVHEKASHMPFGRPTPHAVADAVAFLLNAPFTTDCIIPV